MSNNNDFFGHVFEDPDDDPLLGGEETEPSVPPDEPGDLEDQPSWMSEETEPVGASSNASSNGASQTGASVPAGSNQKEIVVDQEGDDGDGIDALNRAVEQGWRLVRISLPPAGEEQNGTARRGHQVVAILQKEEPQSLFDFG